MSLARSDRFLTWQVRWALFLALVCAMGSTVASVEVDLASDPGVVRLDGVDFGDKLGNRVAWCDFDGDGVQDLLVGVPGASGNGNNRPSAGEAYLVLGRPVAWPAVVNIADVIATRFIAEEAFDELVGVACGDVNGDGHDDIVLGAQFSGSVANSRQRAGQLHLILGGSPLPELVDLDTMPGTTIFGDIEEGTLGRNVAVADIDGDGFLDIVADADDAPSKSGSTMDAGRLYVVFGRSVWPTTLDLRVDRDLIIYSAEVGNLGRSLLLADVDSDGASDILANIRLADGPGDQRDNAGDVHLFFGGPAWPTEIDLAVDSSDSVVFGADAGDQAGSARGIGVGDLDGDGDRELIVGLRLADGRGNTSNLVGEVRVYDPAGSIPMSVDLAIDSTSTIYGEDAVDTFGDGINICDVDGDGVDDLVVSASFSDGPANARQDAGGGYVFLGRQGFPSDLDVSRQDQDVSIFGAAAFDNVGVRGVSDLNGDGITEVVLATDVTGGAAPAIWLVSPVDTDGDGFGNLRDNCALSPNPGQEDLDVDDRGDICDNCPSAPNSEQLDTDSDRVGDACDNCIAISNSTQSDFDADSEGDACDSDDGMIHTFFESRDRIEWQMEQGFGSWNLYRGDLSVLRATGEYTQAPGSNPLAAQFCELSSTGVDDPLQPSAGDVAFYLVSGVSIGSEGGLGSDSAGLERPNTNPCP